MKYFTLYILFIGFTLNTQNTLLKANYHYDSDKGEFGGYIEVLVQQNKIKAIGNKLSYDASKTKVIDLGEATLLPGLIDAHTHVLIEEELHPNYFGFGETVAKNVITKSDAYRALEGASRAKSYLHEGFTTIRDLGNSGLYADVDLRNAIDNELIVGSRMFVSGPGIAATGGQAYGLSFSYSKDIAHKDYQIINDKQEAIAAVRDHVLMRVDLIKVHADNIPNKTTLSLEELAVIVQEAKRHDKKVTAHAITDRAIWNAAKAGVCSIEHAYIMRDSTLNFIKQKGITLIPTYSNKEISNEMFLKSGMSDSTRRKGIIERSAKRQQSSLMKLYKSNVKLAFGSDFYSKISHSRGESAKKSMYAWLEAGIPLEKVLQYATKNAAFLVNTPRNKFGVLKEKYTADIIAVKGDLSKDSKLLEQCKFVMKNGKVIPLNN
ncbi:amidohydrolase family protein [Polaribacter porphyrae]|uniref:Amidohydrolase-related domain-containing protein n=1 Tax=Polaribacter porphyrae TaxID=1137780 RepID=A0A2S7WQH7_9FLAO|nr:amidohydrolase family protein [Polaribacter porphyrae]PQJ79867.1 hypothetical protein BTO18_12085 [Polaribacter porphyrae]